MERSLSLFLSLLLLLCLTGSHSVSLSPSFFNYFLITITIPWYLLLAIDSWGSFCNQLYSSPKWSPWKQFNKDNKNTTQRILGFFFLFPSKFPESPLISSLESICKYFLFKADLMFCFCHGNVVNNHNMLWKCTVLCKPKLQFCISLPINVFPLNLDSLHPMVRNMLDTVSLTLVISLTEELFRS